jgi:(2Fe-2S) ferredoxin
MRGRVEFNTCVGSAPTVRAGNPVDLRTKAHQPCAVPQRKRYLFVCTNRRPDGTPKGSCAARGAVEIHALLKDALRARGLASVEARACTASCLDVCWVGPVVAVEPDGFFYGRVTVDDVPAIVAALETGDRVERLVLPPTDFDEQTAAAVGAGGA